VSASGAAIGVAETFLMVTVPSKVLETRLNTRALLVIVTRLSRSSAETSPQMPASPPISAQTSTPDIEKRLLHPPPVRASTKATRPPRINTVLAGSGTSVTTLVTTCRPGTSKMP
jgi:hypothetical protein